MYLVYPGNRGDRARLFSLLPRDRARGKLEFSCLGTFKTQLATALSNLL